MCFTPAATEASCTLPLTPETWEVCHYWGELGSSHSGEGGDPCSKSHRACLVMSDSWSDTGTACKHWALAKEGELDGSDRFYCNDSGKQTKKHISVAHSVTIFMILCIDLQVCWVVQLQAAGPVPIGSMSLSCWDKKLLMADDRGSSSQDKPGTFKTSAQVTDVH